MVSWNAGGPKAAEVDMDDTMEELKQKAGLGMVGLQEVRFWPVGQRMKDYSFIQAAPRGGVAGWAALAIPLECARAIRAKKPGFWCTSAVVGAVGITSAYFPCKKKTRGPEAFMEV